MTCTWVNDLEKGRGRRRGVRVRAVSATLADLLAMSPHKKQSGRTHLEHRQCRSLIEGDGVKRLPARTAPILRLNSLCPYYTMFPLAFPFRALQDAAKGDWVLDPFCGRGTTNFAARLRGLPSVGVDSSPVAAAIAKAKMVSVSSDDVIKVCRDVLSACGPPREVPEGEFWSLCYHPKTLEELCVLRESLRDSRPRPEHVALTAILLGLLHGPTSKGVPSYASNQMPRSYATKPVPAVRYWKARGLRPKKVSLLDLVSRRAKFSFHTQPPLVAGSVRKGDSRNLPNELSPKPFRWVVTSPPYFGMRSYVPDQWLRNWFLGGPADVPYTTRGQVRHGVDEFASDLAQVWQRCAKQCAAGARLIVRFGALPSGREGRVDLLKQSLIEAECGWRVLTTRRAGVAPRQRRQATQFKRVKSAAAEEIDVYARLEK
jgi:hypothetical protein